MSIYIYIYIYDIIIYKYIDIYILCNNKQTNELNTLFNNFKFNVVAQSSGYTDVILHTSGTNLKTQIFTSLMLMTYIKKQFNFKIT